MRLVRAFAGVTGVAYRVMMMGIAVAYCIALREGWIPGDWIQQAFARLSHG